MTQRCNYVTLFLMMMMFLVNERSFISERDRNGNKSSVKLKNEWRIQQQQPCLLPNNRDKIVCPGLVVVSNRSLFN